MNGNDQERAPEVGSVHAVVGEISEPQVQPALVGPTTAQEYNTIQTAIIPVACWRLDDIRFAFDSSFIQPEIAPEMKLLARLVREHPGAQAALFGHADPVGDPEYNKKLSGRRAAAVYAVLTRNSEIWEDIYSQTGRFVSPLGSDAWGLTAVQTMLSTLGYDPGSIDGRMGGQTRDAVRRFQSAQNENGGEILAVDGDPGPRTRARLFSAYADRVCRDENDEPFRMESAQFLGQGADPFGKGDFQGCGESNPLLMFSHDENARLSQPDNRAERNRENAPNRRVLLLLFRRGSRINLDRWPCPRANEGTEGCRRRFFSDYQTRSSFHGQRREFQNTRDTFSCRFYQRISDGSPCESLVQTGGNSTGCVLILTDLMIDEGMNAEDVYTLAAADGGFSRSLSTKDDALPGDEWVSLLFEAVPTDKRYSLHVRLYNGSEYGLIDDVPYNDLAKVPERLTPMIDRDPDEKHEAEAAPAG